MRTKTFLLTLKMPIKVRQQRADKSPIILKTSTLQVEWPCDGIALTCVRNECGHGSLDDCRQTYRTVETPLVDVTVTGFEVDDQGGGFWESPLRKSGCEPFEIQLKRDNVLARQEITLAA